MPCGASRQVLHAALIGRLHTVAPARREAIARIAGIGCAHRSLRGSHSLVGTRAPDLSLANGTRLYEALGGGWVRPRHAGHRRPGRGRGGACRARRLNGAHVG